MLQIIENIPNEIENFHKRGWGGDEYTITMKEIKALLDGKCLAIDDGEYTHVLYLNKEELTNEKTR
jgi:urease accessory protein UreE